MPKTLEEISYSENHIKPIFYLNSVAKCEVVMPTPDGTQAPRSLIAENSSSGQLILYLNDMMLQIYHTTRRSR
jgi:hypothetical protein